MRPVLFRELKELLLPCFLLAISAGIVGGSTTGPLDRHFDDLVAFCVIGGLALGCLQGVLDRIRREDLFALHRPVAAGRMELARTLAGVAVAMLGLLVLVGAHRYATKIEELSLIRRRVAEAMASIRPDLSWNLDQLDGGDVALLGALLLAAWATARLAVGSVRPRWAPASLLVLPLAAWSFMSRAELAVLLTLGLATLFCLGSWLCLVGDRR